MDLPDTPESSDGTPLNASQVKAWGAMRRLLADEREADARYDALPESKNGRIISTDIARFLDERYARPPKKGLRDINPGWNLAWRYAQDRFTRELRKRAGRKIVRFMAGGWAAGKTHALEKEQPCHLAWDGTLDNPVAAAEKIDLALSEGWKVVVAYVFRDIELAFYGAVERGQKEGRMVPLHELPKTHRKVQESILKLAVLYGSNTRVSFVLLHNLGTRNVVCDTLNIPLKTLESSGALHYTLAHEDYYVQAASQIGKGRVRKEAGRR